jgi:hypothetical protein
MASAYSQDLCDGVIDAVVRGEMSRRAAAARFGVSESCAIKWVQRLERNGSRAASKMGGYLRPRLEPHREFLEALGAEKSDIVGIHLGLPHFAGSGSNCVIGCVMGYAICGSPGTVQGYRMKTSKDWAPTPGVRRHLGMRI